jgi:hypothetical protein
MLMKANTTLLGPSLKNRVRVQKLIPELEMIRLSVMGNEILSRI